MTNISFLTSKFKTGRQTDQAIDRGIRSWKAGRLEGGCLAMILKSDTFNTFSLKSLSQDPPSGAVHSQIVPHFQCSREFYTLRKGTIVKLVVG